MQTIQAKKSKEVKQSTEKPQKSLSKKVPAKPVSVDEDEDDSDYVDENMDESEDDQIITSEEENDENKAENEEKPKLTTYQQMLKMKREKAQQKELKQFAYTNLTEKLLKSDNPAEILNNPKIPVLKPANAAKINYEKAAVERKVEAILDREESDEVKGITKEQRQEIEKQKADKLKKKRKLGDVWTDAVEIEGPKIKKTKITQPDYVIHAKEAKKQQLYEHLTSGQLLSYNPSTEEKRLINKRAKRQQERQKNKEKKIDQMLAYDPSAAEPSKESIEIAKELNISPLALGRDTVDAIIAQKKAENEEQEKLENETEEQKAQKISERVAWQKELKKKNKMKNLWDKKREQKRKLEARAQARDHMLAKRETGFDKIDEYLKQINRKEAREQKKFAKKRMSSKIAKVKGYMPTQFGVHKSVKASNIERVPSTVGGRLAHVQPASVKSTISDAFSKFRKNALITPTNYREPKVMQRKNISIVFH